MKKFYSICMAVLAVIVLSVSITLVVRSRSYRNDFFRANVEALTDIEGSIIICDDGNCGQCFKEETAWPVYKCDWTGMQKDYCDCNKIGFLSEI